MLALGIGCLWFARKDIEKTYDAMDAMDHREHYQIIRRELEAIPNISNVCIDEPKYQGFLYVDVDEDDDRSKFFPYLSGSSIKFKLNLPLRIQKLHTIRDSGSGSEDFDIFLTWHDDTPVCYISYAATDTDVSPSTAIVAVRKFLETHFENNSKQLSFETLGPSPFHADFYIIGKQDESPSDPIMFIEDESYAGYRYGDFRCFYKMSKIPDDAEALECFAYRYGESISTFYMTVVHRNRLLRASFKSKQLLQEVLAVQNSTGLTGVVDRIRKTPKISRDLSISLLQEELIKMDMQSHVSGAQRRQAVLADTPFDEFVAREVEDISGSPTSSVRDLLSIFEERYLKNIENLTVVGAGLIGGVLGSALTYLLGK